MSSKKLSFLDQYLTLWIFLAMALGIGLGAFFPSLPNELERMQVGTTNIPIAIGLIVMMFPPLTKVNYSMLPKVFSNKRVLGISLWLNWVVGPVLMFGLAWLFLPEAPGYRSGLILIGLARCIAMVIVWNDLADGSAEYGAGLVALNSVFQVFAYSLYAWFFISWLPNWLGLEGMRITLEMATVAESVLLYLGVPFVLGIGLRQWALTSRGQEWLQKTLLPILSPLTLIALLLTIVMMFALKGEQLLTLPMDVIRIAIPLLVYFAVMFGVGYVTTKWMGAPYDQQTAVAFTAAGNNFELAIAVAVAVFGLSSDQAFAGVIGPLVEVPALILLVRVALRWKRHLGA